MDGPLWKKGNTEHVQNLHCVTELPAKISFKGLYGRDKVAKKKLIGNPYPFFNEVHSFNVFAWEGNIWYL